jgi:hypothetical protein
MVRVGFHYDFDYVHQTTRRHISTVSIFSCYIMQQFLYCTVTTEKAAKHIVASKIRKWPHRGTFSASSRLCTYLYMRRRGIIKLLEKNFCKGVFTAF